MTPIWDVIWYDIKDGYSPSLVLMEVWVCSVDALPLRTLYQHHVIHAMWKGNQNISFRFLGKWNHKLENKYVCIIKWNDFTFYTQVILIHLWPPSPPKILSLSFPMTEIDLPISNNNSNIFQIQSEQQQKGDIIIMTIMFCYWNINLHK